MQTMSTIVISGAISNEVHTPVKCPLHLSNGVKILHPGLPLKLFATNKSVVHGLHLDY